ncbi:mucin-5AC-like [Mya arenaria]|uniref:mucin-5AC-like n=1 Tax=Mya arenaria TaxID=6604 RepID=UPI0022E33254|nr:mucin-5AC-like [Mya arenaria]
MDMLDNSTNPPLTYAYVWLINQTFNVRFAKKYYLKKSLCAADSTSTGAPKTPRETQPTYSKSTTTHSKSTTGPVSSSTSTRNVITTDTHPTQAPALNTSTTPTSHQVPKGTAASLNKDEGGSSVGLVVGVVIAVTLPVAAVLVVIVKRRNMARACFNNAATTNTSGQPFTGLSSAVDNQQQVEYVNIANNEMHIHTGNNMESNTYEKLNTNKGVDNYLSLQEINGV